MLLCEDIDNLCLLLQVTVKVLNYRLIKVKHKRDIEE